MNNAQNKANELSTILRDIVLEIVLHESEVRVKTTVVHDVVAVKIEANNGDVKRIIGSRGAHFQSLRVICKWFGIKNDLAVSLGELDAPHDRSDRYDEFRPRADWGKARLLNLLERAANAIFIDPTSIECADIDNSSTVVVSVSRGEERDLVSAGGAALEVLGNAMGKKNGRVLTVHVRKDMDAQPATADGRFTKVVARSGLRR